MGLLVSSLTKIDYLRAPKACEVGFVEGRNLVFDARVGEPDAMPGLMASCWPSCRTQLFLSGPR
jgi:hypothetical protein